MTEQWRQTSPGYVECTACGTHGMVWGRWREEHAPLEAHTHPCICGRRYPSWQTLTLHVKGKQRHGVAGHAIVESED